MKKYVLHTLVFCCCQSVTKVLQLVSITLVFVSEKMSVDRENWMVNWPIVTANMSEPQSTWPMRTFDMQGLIWYVSLITCNQSLFDHARECRFYTIDIGYSSKVQKIKPIVIGLEKNTWTLNGLILQVNLEILLGDTFDLFAVLSVTYIRSIRSPTNQAGGRCSETDSMCQVLYTLYLNLTCLHFLFPF